MILETACFVYNARTSSCSAAPSMSVDTGFPRQLPAASGPAASFDSGGKSSRKPFVLKLKTSFLGAPSKSQKTSAPEGDHPQSVHFENAL